MSYWKVLLVVPCSLVKSSGSTPTLNSLHHLHLYPVSQLHNTCSSFHSSNSRKIHLTTTELSIRNLHQLVKDKQLSSSSVEEINTSKSNHRKAELCDSDEWCPIGGEESDKKQAKPASSTKHQRKKQVPAKFRDQLL